MTAKVFAINIRLRGQLMVLGDILPDREGVLYVRYLSSGMDYCVLAVAADSEESLGTL
jgi:hypothetical protein